MEYDPTIWRDAYKMGVDPLDVYRVYPSVIKDFVKKIKEKLILLLQKRKFKLKIKKILCLINKKLIDLLVMRNTKQLLKIGKKPLNLT